ncbi:uncharacterized protein [Watersipora subatra]|uniref:uncharacterized protein n=1 Tax=Watersipora subatra TaxID=2589382 RepID=UPI00355C1571
MHQLVGFPCCLICILLLCVLKVSGDSMLLIPEVTTIEISVDHPLRIDCHARLEANGLMIMQKNGSTAAVTTAFSFPEVNFNPLPAFSDRITFSNSNISGTSPEYRNVTVTYNAPQPNHSDAGNYKCELGSSKATFDVRVLGPPYDMEIGTENSQGVVVRRVAPFSIAIYPLTQSLYEAKVNIAAKGSVILKATAIGTPATNVTWYIKNGTSDWLKTDENSLIELERNWDALLNVSLMASAMNKYGSFNATLNVILEYPPRSPSVLETDLWPSAGGTATSGCTFDADPPASVFYAKENEVTGEWHRIRSQDGLFHLSDIQLKRDAGMYRCIGTNVHGNASANIMVHGDPQEAWVDLVNIYSTSVDLVLHTVCATEVNYTITTMTVDDQGVEKLRLDKGVTANNQLPEVRKDLQISYLEPSTTYSLTIKVMNDFGELQGEPEVFTTRIPGLSRPNEVKSSTQAPPDPSAAPSLLSSLLLLTLTYIFGLL